MDAALLKIFRNSSKEKHYAPNTYSEIPKDKTDLNITSGQNANWTYANFFVQNDYDKVETYRINEGQYVIIKEQDVWCLFDFKKEKIAVGLEEIESFVNKVVAAERVWRNAICGNALNLDSQHINTERIKPNYRPYITAIKSKPFLLLAGISGTGKSRIVRELARACWDEGSKEYKDHSPKNFEMVQVKPNWHDSSELIGYVSRVSGEPEFIAGDFLKFVVKAWENPDVPYFLCLDEMNLAPVEQYFAEYLSVVESRKLQDGGIIKTDAILKPEFEFDSESGVKTSKKWYSKLIISLLAECSPEKMFALKTQFEEEGITIPQNLIVVGTVNMDETTFSFSRKVLDRAMTIEMNEVDLNSGLANRHEQIGKLSSAELIGSAVEGVDVYESYKDDCDKVINYLNQINEKLEGTPFKVAYRTRNEFMLYVINNLPYNKDKDGKELKSDYIIQRALDEITSMKVLSRIEGDETKVPRTLLTSLEDVIKSALPKITETNSVSLKKLKEMKKRLESGYTSFWS